MTESKWLACTDPTPMLELLRGKASERKLRLFACACCRRVWHFLVNKRSREAVEVAERYADSAATDQELEALRQDAWEYSDHLVHEDENHLELAADALNAADAPAWATEWPVDPLRVVVAAQRAAGTVESKAQADLIRCIFGNPFRPVVIDPSWLTPTVTSLGTAAYEERALPSGELDRARLGILADALEEAGCQDAAILGHLRSPGLHVRGCWAVDACVSASSER